MSAQSPEILEKSLHYLASPAGLLSLHTVEARIEQDLPDTDTPMRAQSASNPKPIHLPGRNTLGPIFVPATCH